MVIVVAVEVSAEKTREEGWHVRVGACRVSFLGGLYTIAFHLKKQYNIS